MAAAATGRGGPCPGSEAAAAMDEADPKKKGEAYRRGCSAALDWYARVVGGPMGWTRSSPMPRPRMGRGAAQAARQAELERKAQELEEESQRLARDRAALIEYRDKLRGAADGLNARRAQLDADAQELGELRGVVEDQVAIERRMRHRVGPLDDVPF